MSSQFNASRFTAHALESGQPQRDQLLRQQQATGTFNNPRPRPTVTQQQSSDPNNMLLQVGPTKLSPVYKSPKYYFRMRFYDYKKPMPRYGEAGGSEALNDIGQLKYEIELPIPLTLYDRVNIAYGAAELKLLGDMSELVSGFIGAASAGGDTLAAFLQEQLQSSGSAITNRLAYEIAPSFIGGLIGGIPGLGDVTATLQQSFGATTNPNEALVLQGPGLRTWNFRWLIIPHNEEESRNVQILIRELKARSLPYVARTALAPSDNVTGLLGYPQICLINMYPWDKEGRGTSLYEWADNSIVKIKRTMITEVSAQYNSQGSPAFFKDTNNPVSIDLSVSFKEIEYFLSEDEYSTFYSPQLLENTPTSNLQNAPPTQESLVRAVVNGVP